MNSYNQIKITVPIENLSLVTDIMTAIDFEGGLMIEDYSDIEGCKWDYVDTEILNKDRKTSSVSGFIEKGTDVSPILEKLNLLLPENAKLEVIGVKQDDWANNWKKYYKPTRVGKNIVIKPSWEEYDKEPSDVIIELDPGMAFGTGTHETTRMCMIELEKNITENIDVLDVGCGSGILSIVAASLGAKTVTGIDIDPDAVKVAIENGEKNNYYPPKYNMQVGNLVEKLNENKYQVVVANIVANAIIMLLDDVKQFIADDGIFICSGIIEDRIDDVKLALDEKGYKICEVIRDGEWAAMVSKLK